MPCALLLIMNQSQEIRKLGMSNPIFAGYNHRVDVGVSYSKGEEVRGEVYVELVGKMGRTGDVKLSKE